MAVCALVCMALLAGAQDKRTYSVARHTLAIDGQSADAVKSFKGGGVYADVVIVPNGAANGSSKQPGPPRYEDIVVELPVNSPLAQQLASSMVQGKMERKNGSLMAVDMNGNNVSDLRFRDALVTEVTVPACDASKQEAGFLTLKLSPEEIINAKASGKASATGAQSKTTWQSSLFRLQIDGVDCKMVRRIEPLTVKQVVSNEAAGEARIAQKQPGALEFGNVRLVVPESAAEPFRQWFDQLVVRGQTNQEKSGSLTFLNADLKTELAVITFQNLGVIRVSPVAQSSADRPAEVMIEMYCEQMQLGGPGSAQKAQAQAPSDSTASAGSTVGDPGVTAPPAPMVGDRSGIAERTPIVRPTGIREAPQQPPTTEGEQPAFTLVPNAKLPAEIGRLVIRFPEGTERRDYQRIQFPKDQKDIHAAIEWGSLAKELAPGEYIVAVNGKMVEGVKVEAGSDTTLAVGVLRVKAPDGTFFEIVEEDLDNAPAIFSESGPKDIALPPGSYFIRVNKQILPFTIEDAKFTEFATPEPG